MAKCYDKAQKTLQDQNSTPFGQACAIKTVIELGQKYSSNI